MELSFARRSSFRDWTWQRPGDGGVLVPADRLPADMAVGDPVDLQIAFADPPMVFHCHAVTRWHRAGAGGVLWALSLDADRRTHAVLRDFVEGRSGRPLTQRNRRLPARLPVRCVANGQLRETRTGNISEGGAFILSRRPPPEGTLVTLWLGEAKDAVDLDGEVMWRRAAGAASGFGVRFLLRNASVRSAVGELVRRVARPAG